MTYEDLMKSSGWVANTSANYFEQLGAKVLVFKLDKNDTRLNSIYNEEIDGRKYLRPFETKSIYKTNPFSFSFDNTIPSEVDGDLMFYFNFEVMVKTIDALKRATSELRIRATEPGWFISKRDNKVCLFNKKTDPTVDRLKYDTIVEFDLDKYMTISELSQGISDTGCFICKHGGDDFTKCIPNFKETSLENPLIIKTFNSEFRNVGDTIEEGDLIYITTTNALYEVTSAYPVNNTIYRYINWQCNAKRTFAYVEYEKLKSYKYGLIKEK